MASLCHPFWRSLVITVASFEAGRGNEAIWGRKAITACSAADFSWVSCRNREGSKGLLWWFQTMNERPGNEWQYQVDRIGQQSLQHIRACAHTRTHTHLETHTHTRTHTHAHKRVCTAHMCMIVCGCVVVYLFRSMESFLSCAMRLGCSFLLIEAKVPGILLTLQPWHDYLANLAAAAGNY